MTPHDEIVSGLNYIGRNVAQQDALRLRMVQALESLVLAVWMVGFGIIIALWLVVGQIAGGAMSAFRDLDRDEQLAVVMADINRPTAAELRPTHGGQPTNGRGGAMMGRCDFCEKEQGHPTNCQQLIRSCKLADCLNRFRAILEQVPADRRAFEHRGGK